MGPDLLGVTQRRERIWLIKWLRARQVDGTNLAWKSFLKTG
jgi:hypothetical protein